MDITSIVDGPMVVSLAIAVMVSKCLFFNHVHTHTFALQSLWPEVIDCPSIMCTHILLPYSDHCGLR